MLTGCNLDDHIDVRFLDDWRVGLVDGWTVNKFTDDKDWDDVCIVVDDWMVDGSDDVDNKNGWSVDKKWLIDDKDGWLGDDIWTVVNDLMVSSSDDWDVWMVGAGRIVEDNEKVGDANDG